MLFVDTDARMQHRNRLIWIRIFVSDLGVVIGFVLLGAICGGRAKMFVFRLQVDRVLRWASAEKRLVVWEFSFVEFIEYVLVLEGRIEKSNNTDTTSPHRNSCELAKNKFHIMQPSSVVLVGYLALSWANGKWGWTIRSLPFYECEGYNWEPCYFKAFNALCPIYTGRIGKALRVLYLGAVCFEHPFCVGSSTTTHIYTNHIDSAVGNLLYIYSFWLVVSNTNLVFPLWIFL